MQEVTVEGVIAATLRGDGRRQFTRANPQSYWTDRGSSGSPVFVGTGEQLAGIISLSETGRKSGESTIHEAFVVPGTVVRRYLDVLISVRRVGERENIPAAQLQPILDAIGAVGTPPAEIPSRLRAFVESARARAVEPVPSSSEGADIDAAIRALDADLAKLRSVPHATSCATSMPPARGTCCRPSSTKKSRNAAVGAFRCCANALPSIASRSTTRLPRLRLPR